MLLGEFVVGLELVLANTKLICNVGFVEKEFVGENSEQFLGGCWMPFCGGIGLWG